MSYNRHDDELMQALTNQIPRCPVPIWYLPIKNTESVALRQALSRLDAKELKSALSWEGSAQWRWQIRTAMGYAIWSGNKEAVEILINYGADVKEDVCEEMSSEVRFDGGMRWSSLAYCVECRKPKIIPILRKAGATEADWTPEALFNLKGSSLDEKVDSFWRSGGEEVTKALLHIYHGRNWPGPRSSQRLPKIAESSKTKRGST